MIDILERVTNEQFRILGILFFNLHYASIGSIMGINIKRKRVCLMDYLTIKEASEKWGIGSRIISVYCAEGRIKEAVKKGNLWLIAKNAERPVDKRRKDYKAAKSINIG